MWIIADGVPGFPTETPGVVCHRLGVGPMKPKGQSWDYGIGVRSPLTAHVDSRVSSRFLTGWTQHVQSRPVETVVFTEDMKGIFGKILKKIARIFLKLI